MAWAHDRSEREQRIFRELGEAIWKSMREAEAKGVSIVDVSGSLLAAVIFSLHESGNTDEQIVDAVKELLRDVRSPEVRKAMAEAMKAEEAEGMN